MRNPGLSKNGRTLPLYRGKALVRNDVARVRTRLHVRSGGVDWAKAYTLQEDIAIENRAKIT